MKRLLFVFGLVAVTIAPTMTYAQQYGVAAHIGTMGIGADFAYAATPRVGLRAGINVIPIEFEVTESDNDFTLQLQSPQITAMADLYLVGPLRLSGGVRYTNTGIVMTADVSGTIDLGAATYTLDSLSGTIVTPKVAPYIGIGIGNPAGSRFGFFADLGIAYQGEPEFELVGYGTATTAPGFEANRASEEQDIEDELGVYFKVYPVISLGFSIGF